MRGTIARPRAAAFVAACALVLLAALLGPLTAPTWGASTPPPTPVPPNGSPSPFPTVLHTPRPSLTAPPVGAPAAILEDLRTGQVLFEKAPDSRRPIASLTKVMTALVVLDHAKPGDMVTASGRAASASGSVLGLQVGERISVRELLFALMLQSSNDAAVALAEHVGGSVEGFVSMMNRRASRMGLSHSHFTSPSGLDNGGMSTARDLAAVTRAVYANSFLERVAATKFHDVPSPRGQPRHIQNRNVLLWLYPGAIGVKTGFTTPAGHCLIAAADRRDTRLVAVVMGASGPDDGGVFDDGAALLNYGYAAYSEQALISVGEPLGSFTVDGSEVPAVAGATLLRLVKNDEADEVTVTTRIDRSIALPITAGDTIGRVIVRVGGRLAGEVPAIAATSASGAPPQSPPEPPVPVTALERGLEVLRVLVQALLGPFL